MTVINTQTWLENYLLSKGESTEDNLSVQSDQLIAPICSRVNESDQFQLHWQLLGHGLFLPCKQNHSIIQPFIDRDFWKLTNDIFMLLKKEWSGPDIPIFLLPADHTNEQLTKNFNGVSGLSFPDKLFLFVGKDTTKKQLAALFVHEYSHIFRLQKLNQEPMTSTLMDTLILEGTAEVTVREKLGKDYLLNTNKKVTNESVQFLWKNWIQPNLNLSKSDAYHDQLIYGGNGVPKAAGYMVGYYLVDKQYDPQHTEIVDLLQLPTGVFFQTNVFKNVR